jgi:hypothetical protein
MPVAESANASCSRMRRDPYDAVVIGEGFSAAALRFI